MWTLLDVNFNATAEFQCHVSGCSPSDYYALTAAAAAAAAVAPAFIDASVHLHYPTISILFLLDCFARLYTILVLNSVHCFTNLVAYLGTT